jgi:hypothetical protein
MSVAPVPETLALPTVVAAPSAAQLVAGAVPRAQSAWLPDLRRARLLLAAGGLH